MIRFVYSYNDIKTKVFVFCFKRVCKNIFRAVTDSKQAGNSSATTKEKVERFVRLCVYEAASKERMVWADTKLL